MPFFCIHCRSEIDSKFKACPYCGEPITDFLRKHLEHPLDGKYQILSRLGIGGMGEVYKVLHLHLNSIRVINLMRTSIAGEPGADDRFIREARVLASLNHPKIAAIYAVEERALVMELVEGPTLAERIAQGPIPLEEALPIARQISEAFEYAHERGVIHRDLKPANIKVTPEGRVKVLDFGLAKALSNEAASTDPASSPTLPD